VSGDGVIRAVVFDWGGTLTPWHTMEPADAWRACGLGDAAAEALWAAEQAAWARARDTRRSSTMDDVFAAAGVHAGADQLAAYYAWWEEHTYTDPDARPLFEALHERGIKVGVLSNTLWPRAEHERVFRRDGVLDLIDAAVYTSEIEWTKPHPEAFRAALAALGGIAPEDAVFVGDRPWDDIAGAQGVGMRAVLVPHSRIPAYQLVPVQGEADAVVQRLADVLDLVERWG
jgi:putative hydrolase of the HAD superfamily